MRFKCLCNSGAITPEYWWHLISHLTWPISMVIKLAFKEIYPTYFYLDIFKVFCCRFVVCGKNDQHTFVMHLFADERYVTITQQENCRL